MSIDKIDLIYHLFGIYIVTLMFYVFSSGGLQPAHLLFLLMFTIFIKNLLGYSLELLKSYKVLYAIIFYVGFVNISNFAFVTQDSRFLVAPFYYIFNVLVFCTAFALCYWDEVRFKKMMSACCVIAVALQLLAVVTGFGDSVRSTGTFNNPNQLGYWGLMIFIVYAISNPRTSVKLIDVFFCFSCVLVVLFSLSKAATVAVVVAAIIFLFFRVNTSNSRANLKNSLGLLMILPVGLLLSVEMANLIVGDVFTQVIDSSSNRLSKIGTDSDDNAAGRNYDRIWRFPEYLVVGSGEGGYYRFTVDGKNNEIHSSLGTIIFSYGLFGVYLFLSFFFRLARHAPLSDTIYILPIFLYSITHQGLRSSLFWIYLALLAFEIAKSGKKRQRISWHH